MVDEQPACAVTVDEVQDYLAGNGMQLDAFTVQSVETDRALVRWSYDDTKTRPGGAISGPTIMQLVDLASWVAVFTRAGIVPMAVTWDLKTNFLRPALGGDLLAEATVLRFGRFTYLTVDVVVADDPAVVVSHATVTYAVPR